jgi:hypothetical protein
MINEHDIKDFPGSPYASGLVCDKVAGYCIERSLADFKLFNVFAVNYMSQVLWPMVIDVSFELAVKYKESYDSELNNKG